MKGCWQLVCGSRLPSFQNSVFTANLTVSSFPYKVLTSCPYTLIIIFTTTTIWISSFPIPIVKVEACILVLRAVITTPNNLQGSTFFPPSGPFPYHHHHHSDLLILHSQQLQLFISSKWRPANLSFEPLMQRPKQPLPFSSPSPFTTTTTILISAFSIPNSPSFLSRQSGDLQTCF